MKTHEKMKKKREIRKMIHKMFHERIHAEIRNNRKKYRKFSRKIFLTLGITIITVLTVTNLIIGSLFSFFRYYHQKNYIKEVVERVEEGIEQGYDGSLETYLEDIIYDGVYIKIESESKKHFDTYSGYWRAKKERKLLSFIELQEDTEIEGVSYRISVVRDLANEKNFIVQFVVIMILINLFSIFIIFLISRMVTVKILMPINNITDTAEKITSENLSERIDIFPIDDELSRLSRVINSMIDRLEKAFNMQKKFVSDASHELRTPLQIIKGYTDFILEKGSRDEAVLNESLSFIKEEVDGMISLTENLLFMARSEKDKRDLKLEEIDMYELSQKIKSNISLIKPQTEFSVKGDRGVKIKLDKDLILEVLRALIDNGIKYSPMEGGRVELRYYIENREFVIEVEDNGIGIDKKELGNVFERFYRIDESRSKDIKGNGLGLAIVKNIVELHDGTIDIRSELNKGTTVRLIFPYNN